MGTPPWCWLWLWGRQLSLVFLLLYMPSLWLSLEAGGYAALATAVLVLLILADVIVEVVASVKAAGAVAGWGVAGGCSCCYGCA